MEVRERSRSILSSHPLLVSRYWSLAVQLIAASVLILAAMLKLASLAGDSGGVLTILLAGSELLLAAWVFSGLYPRAAYAALLVCFCLFACTASYQIYVRSASCGCFGPLSTPPWAVLLLDIAILCLLFTTPVETSPWRYWPESLSSLPARCVAITLTLAAAATLAFCVLTESATAQSSIPVSATDWLGLPFPLLGKTTIDKLLLRGDWKIVLYRESCDHCRQVLSTLAPPQEERLALICLSPHSKNQSEFHIPRGALLGAIQVREDEVPFIAAPVIIHIRDGIVQSVDLDGSDQARNSF